MTAVEYPDAERLMIDLVDSLTDNTVGADLPSTWTKGAGTFVQVQWDGTPVLSHPVLAHATVRVTVFASSPTVAQGVANRLMGLLLDHDGSAGIASITPLTGVLPAKDPTTQAALASFTVRCTVRASLIV